MIFHVCENLAIAEATILAEPRNNRGLGKPLGLQERKSEAEGVVAASLQRCVQMIEELGKVRL